ncbi:SDR family NAD(P)-dependent oxidoreductase [bacterium]|nr:SDR family NAD(P)-dependent oxidoreductase [bacterium]
MTTRRIILVTGASRGIGRAAALGLAKAGHHVIALARSEKALIALDDEARALTGEALTLIPLDLGDARATDALAGELLKRFGRLDGLLGNAGVLGMLGPIEMASPSSFNQTIDINLSANWRLIRAVHPLLAASTAARVLFVTSGAAVRPRAFWGPYAASKAGLEAMVMCYADENDASSIRINVFDPGPTRTDMRFKAMPGEDRSRLPAPEDVAALMIPYLDAACTAHGQRIEAPRPT